jgi:putative SOS response-associated peptidase YedK
VCGRFTLLTDLSVITETFAVQDVAGEYSPSHNVFPGQQVAVVVHDKANRLVNFRWGLIPSWAKDPLIGGRLINARAETVAEKPSFRAAFQKHRCLVLADGFYEWKREDKRKIPMHFSLKSGRPFGFAGLYEHWRSPEGQVIGSCTIITTNANALVAAVHDRMPVILPKGAETEWIDSGKVDPRKLLPLLQPYPPGEMQMRPIDPPSLSG